MRTNLLSAFTTYLASRIPCNPNFYTWTREHVIPKSIIRNRHVTEDPQNIIPMPKELNQARGNRPYTPKWRDGFLKYACSNCPHPGFCRAAMVVSPDGVHPPDILKGPIARSVLHSIETYPQHAETINAKVLNVEVALKWNSSFPASKAELDFRKKQS
jgi:endonuclease I